MDQRFRRYRSDRDLRRCGVYDSAGGYRSRWYQGFDDGMEWLRLSLEGVSGVKVWVFAIDQPPGIWDDSLEPVLVGDGADFSLYGVRGRYLCFTAAPAEGLVGYTLTFPGRSIDAGLPFVLRDDAALRQFLAVYQSAYMDVNQEAARFPGRLDPHSLTPLPDLGLWVGAASWMGETAGLPDLLAAASKINRMRGTRRGLDLLIKLVTGGCGELVEDFQWRNQTLNKAEREDCTRLYGGGHASVTLLLPVDRIVQYPSEYAGPHPFALCQRKSVRRPAYHRLPHIAIGAVSYGCSEPLEQEFNPFFAIAISDASLKFTITCKHLFFSMISI